MDEPDAAAKSLTGGTTATTSVTGGGMTTEAVKSAPGVLTGRAMTMRGWVGLPTGIGPP
jgi:hypothetical protein